MAKTITITPEEQSARTYVDRLILTEISELQTVVKLSEIADRLSDEGIGLAAVRSLLASNPDRFSYNERRWVPAARIEGHGRPVAEQIRLTVERFGGPMPLHLVLSELSILRPLVDEESIERLLTHHELLALTPKGNVFLREWCFAATDEYLNNALANHSISQDEFDALSKTLSDVDWREIDSAAKILAKASPINARTVGAVAWHALSPQDPRAYHLYDWKVLYGELFDCEEFVLAGDGKFYAASETKRWITNTLKLADKLAPTVEIEDSQPIEVQDEDVERMIAKIATSDKSITATRILEEFYEITPTVKTFPDDLANVIAALNGRDEVRWVGGDRFNKPNAVPEFVQSVPDLFQYVPTDFTDEEGEFIDVELTDEGLSSTLRKLLNHPLAVDVLDEEPLLAPKIVPDSTRCVLKSIHRELGTFPIAQITNGFFENTPKYQEIIVIDPSGRELQIWLNAEARLLFGFIDWFYDQSVESGAVFQLTKTARPNVLDFEWLDQTDPVVYITAQRMEELRELQSRSEGMSTYDVMREVMAHWPKGADFLTLLWEINVVRRTSRRMTASLLSSYACFYQRSGSPVWHYDHKKVDQGFDKSKKKFIKK